MSLIEVRGLSKAYGAKQVVDDVTFDVEAGEIFGILGPNGAGKTTSVECIAGLRKPDSGHVRVAGLDPQRQHPQVTQLLGVQLQESALPDKITTVEAINLFRQFYADPADGAELMAVLGLDGVADTQFRRLSGGQRQRLSIALALIGQPKIAILDELTTGLDPVSRRDTWSLVERIRDWGVTILLVTHFMEEAERLCNRVAIIDHGRVIALDSPQALAAHVGAGQVLRFRTSEPVSLDALRGLPAVTAADQHEQDVVVRGTEQAVQTVMTYLSAQSLIASDIRLESHTLDDAFVALTREADQADQDAATAPDEPKVP